MTSDQRPQRTFEVHHPLSDSNEVLARARIQAEQRRLFDDYFVVDVDAHVGDDQNWKEVLSYSDSPVIREAADSTTFLNGQLGLQWQAVWGRIPHGGTGLREPVADKSVPREVALARKAIDQMGLDYQIMFTGAMLTLGMHPVPEIEAALANAFNQWMVERILPEEDRVRAFLYLPFNDPKAAEATVERYLGAKGVAGFLVSSMRHKPVHANEYMRLYRMLEESGQVLAFHAANTWQDQYTGQLNKFLSMHAISFTLCNMVHITNWVVNGMPERFPKLKVIWVESGLAWVPFMMQRLDHEYMMRSSEAPLLKGLPSDYMRQMYYTSQPMEHTSDEMLEMTFKAINAKTQLLYASDWPHWDFDLPAKVVDLPFLDDEARRNILGLNAARIFGLEVPERYRLAAQRQAAE